MTIPFCEKLLSMPGGDIEGVAWPPVRSGAAATLVNIIQGMEDSQWLPAEAIARGQFEQLGMLAAWAGKHSPYFAHRLALAGLEAKDLATPEGLARLPVLGRREIQQAGQDLFCREVPAAHLPFNETRTSGSTGEPVVVKRTLLTTLLWMACTIRDSLWQGADYMARSLVIRASVPERADYKDWGQPYNIVGRTGVCLGLPIVMDIKEQLREILEFAPERLLIYPNTLEALLALCQKEKVSIPSVRQLETIGETLSPGLRKRASEFFGCKIHDTYSSQEIGVMAMQCPDSDNYHVMAESVILEVLREDGSPCAPGETGRVVVTCLHNLATPLVRYEIGDYAEVGGPCKCGRGLPVLAGIRGRSRNLVVKPDGTRHWPQVGFDQFWEIAGVVQYQFIQHDVEHIEMRLVVESPLTPVQEEKLRLHLQKSLAHPFRFTFTYFDGWIPRPASGKFDEFICKV